MVIMGSVVITDTGDPVLSLFHDMVNSGGHVSFITALAIPLPLKLAKRFPEKPSRPVDKE